MFPSPADIQEDQRDLHRTFHIQSLGFLFTPLYPILVPVLTLGPWLNEGCTGNPEEVSPVLHQVRLCGSEDHRPYEHSYDFRL